MSPSLFCSRVLLSWKTIRILLLTTPQKCHAKTMMSRKANEELIWTPSMWHLGRSWRKKYEGGGQKGCGVTRTDETRRYERPWWKVEGNGDPHDRDFSQNQVDRTLKSSQASSAKKSKLIRFLGSSFIDRADTSTILHDVYFQQNKNDERHGKNMSR